jgi:hypothetical protein
MSEDTLEKMLIEEQKIAFDHLRFLETKRDHFVLGCLTASGAVLAFIAQVLSKDYFRVTEASAEFITGLVILCLTVGVLSWFLRRAYVSLSPVMQHYENVIAVTRSVLYGENGKQPIKIKTDEKLLIEWLDARENEEINKRSISVSRMSEIILYSACWFWLFAGLCIFFLFIFTHCKCFVC